MTNTPKLPEERLDDVIERLEPYFEELYTSGSFSVFNLKVAIKKEVAQELETLKAQVRKEIEGRRLLSIAKYGNMPAPHDPTYKDGFNEAITDCLSIPSLKEASNE